MAVCYLALGGNTGDVASAFDRALALLPSRGIDVICRSRLYATQPVGASAGGRFLNAAVEATTNLSPHEVLQVLHQVEDQLGRRRTERWGPRTIDIDLVLYGFERLSQPGLTVPHPSAWQRRFVLDPLWEIAPQSFHPGFNLRTEQLRDRLLVRPLPVALVGEAGAPIDSASRRLHAEFGDRIKFVDDPLWGAIAFRIVAASAATDLPWCIPVAPLPGGEQSMIDVLAAALDEPRPLD
jgi:2-amino-4-hydroxy-6-hydroxymethyldihydropteridine diphosphokinase